MILDNNINISNFPNKFDIIIIGAGLSGLYLANELKNIQKKILIIDRGDENKNFDFENRIKNIGINHFSSQNQNNFVLGGHSVNWGGLLAEFERIDFEKNFWGLSYPDIKDLYKEIYEEFGIKEKNSIINKLDENLNFYNTIYLNNLNFFSRYKNIIRKSENIFLVKNVTAYDLKINYEKAEKLICKNSDNKKIEFSAENFIFSMGTFENVRFFLELKKKYKNFLNLEIGNYFHDHLGINIGDVEIYNKNLFRDKFANKYSSRLIARKKISNIRNSFHKLGISGEFTNEDQSKNFLSVKENLKNFAEYKNFKFLFKILNDYKNFKLYKNFFKEYFLKKRIYSFPNGKANFYIQSEQLPIKESKLCITDEILKDGLPKLELNWKLSGVEYDQILDYSEKVNSYLQKNKLGKLNIRINNLEKFYKSIIDTNHASGGLIMSKKYEEGSCDQNQKIWNTDNIYVNGPCVFPNSGYANIGLTILALTKKLANHFK